jgi:hypothetical protein
MNISCAVDGCNENVIGQCPGYKEPCGRYYCRKHSSGKFCDECAAVVERERIYREYNEAAKYANKGTGLLVLNWLLLVPMAIAGIPALFTYLSQNDSRLLINVVMAIPAFFAVIYIFPYVKKQRVKRHAEMCERYANFDRFFTEWKSQRTRDAWKTAGLVAAGIVISTVAAASSSSVENDVRRIRQRLDRM